MLNITEIFMQHCGFLRDKTCPIHVIVLENGRLFVPV